MHDGVEIVDAQVHAWEHLTKPHWSPSYEGVNQLEFPIEMVLAAMDAVGVDAAVFDVLSDDPRGTWFDNAYTEAASARWPERVASVVRDPDFSAPDIDERVAAVRERPGVLGIRMSVASDEQEAAAREGAYDALFAACERRDVPLLLYPSGHLDIIGTIAETFPGMSILIVHLGIPQPPRQRDDPPLLRWPALLRLARHPNIVVEVIGGPALSSAAYPFADLLGPLSELFDAFGMDRMMWGSDFTRLWGYHTYAELFGYLWYSTELSRADKEKLFGGTLRRVLRWNPGALAAAT